MQSSYAVLKRLVEPYYRYLHSLHSLILSYRCIWKKSQLKLVRTTDENILNWNFQNIREIADFILCMLCSAYKAACRAGLACIAWLHSLVFDAMQAIQAMQRMIPQWFIGWCLVLVCTLEFPPSGWWLVSSVRVEKVSSTEDDIPQKSLSCLLCMLSVQKTSLSGYLSGCFL
jgi:hypothetical protein